LSVREELQYISWY